jgi:hypothetical protein
MQPVDLNYNKSPNLITKLNNHYSSGVSTQYG